MSCRDMKVKEANCRQNPVPHRSLHLRHMGGGGSYRFVKPKAQNPHLLPHVSSASQEPGTPEVLGTTHESPRGADSVRTSHHPCTRGDRLNSAFTLWPGGVRPARPRARSASPAPRRSGDSRHLRASLCKNKLRAATTTTARAPAHSTLPNPALPQPSSSLPLSSILRSTECRRIGSRPGHAEPCLWHVQPCPWHGGHRPRRARHSPQRAPAPGSRKRVSLGSAVSTDIFRHLSFR